MTPQPACSAGSRLRRSRSPSARPTRAPASTRSATRPTAPIRRSSPGPSTPPARSTSRARASPTVKYRAFDRIGNDSGVQSQAVRRRHRPPQTTIDATPAAATQDTTPTFEFSADEPGSVFEYRLGGGLGDRDEPAHARTARRRHVHVRGARDRRRGERRPSPPCSSSPSTRPRRTRRSPRARRSPPTRRAPPSRSLRATPARPSSACSTAPRSADCPTSLKSYAGLTEASHTSRCAKDAAGNLDATPAPVHVDGRPDRAS